MGLRTVAESGVSAEIRSPREKEQRFCVGSKLGVAEA